MEEEGRQGQGREEEEEEEPSLLLPPPPPQQQQEEEDAAAGPITTSIRSSSEATTAAGGGACWSVLFEGWMEKRGDYTGTWRRRFFRLGDDGVLRYCGSDGEETNRALCRYESRGGD